VLGGYISVNEDRTVIVSNPRIEECYIKNEGLNIISYRRILYRRVMSDRREDRISYQDYRIVSEKG